MCGISGIFSSNPVINLEKRIHKMNSSIIHRGPDSGGTILLSKSKAMGHRRLSIIDLNSKANQPMQSQSKRWSIVFNGEIYNFKEIAKQLNYKFRTKSDTEVILAAVELKGVKWFLKKANGMFAIALFDNKLKDVFLIRDRLGIKPIYYYQKNGVLVFSSEIKALLASGLVRAEFNDSAIDEYLGNRYVRPPYTFFKNIYQLSSGTFMKFNDSLDKEYYNYWSLPKKFNMSSQYNEDQITKLFENKLIKSIKCRLFSDVPLGTYLSGGIDSSFITAIASLNTNEKLNTYTIGFPELNEFSYASIMARKYKTTHHEILMTKNQYLNQWKNLIFYKDSPLGVPNEIPLAVMSSQLKENISVVLSGEGADELMGGYGRIFRLPFDFDNQEKYNSFYDFLIDEYEYVPRSLRDQVLTTSINYRKEFDDSIKIEFEGKSNEENMFNFFHNYHIKGLLQRVDMTTMQASVEARVPFLDHNLIEFTYKEVPFDLKLKWNSNESMNLAKNKIASQYSEVLDTPKYLLRKVAYNYIPTELVDRKKIGFPVPLTDWFSNLEDLAKIFLCDVKWMKNGALDTLLDLSLKEARAGQILWMFINIEIFKKQYFHKEWEW